MYRCRMPKCMSSRLYTWANINNKYGSRASQLSEEEKQGKQLYINPIECIKCGACIPECPVDAIYRDEKEAILLNDEISVHKNYNFFGETFHKNF